MDAEQFRAAARELIDYVIDYHTNIRDRRVLPEVKPGYLRPLLPPEAPDAPERWSDIMPDIERVIMPGVTHWAAPNFHAYYPTGNTYPSILADILSDAIGCIGFSWIASPACTELEMVMLDWLARLLDLPPHFLSTAPGWGGGVLQSTASEATLVAVLSARTQALKQQPPPAPSSLVLYCSDQAHSSVERAGLLAGVRVHQVASDDALAMRGAALRHALAQDTRAGLTPCIVVGTLGATPACSFDNLVEIGEVATEHNMWFHVDAAYAGAALVCEEHRHLAAGMEAATSFNFNPHKWLLVQFDASAFWVRDSRDIVEAFNVDPLYLKHDHQEVVPDYRHWQIPLGRRFRALKLWFVMRSYGKQGMQAHIRKQVSLAHKFEEYVMSDPRFELILPVTLGLVCFRLKDESNETNEALLKNLNDGGVIHLVPSKARNTYFLRFAVCSRFCEAEDVEKAWREVQRQTALTLAAR